MQHGTKSSLVRVMSSGLGLYVTCTAFRYTQAGFYNNVYECYSCYSVLFLPKVCFLCSCFLNTKWNGKQSRLDQKAFS